MKESYPLNAHAHITNIRQLVNMQSENSPNNVAFQYIQDDNICTVTYKEFKNDIELLGTFFYSENLKTVKIALIGENSYEWILTYFTTILGSNVIVPIDKELSDVEIVNLLSICPVDALVYSPSYAVTANKLVEENIVDKAFDMKKFHTYLRKGAESLNNGFNDFIKNEINENETCSIIFTSGTTGNPKGVMLSQHNLVEDVVGSCENVYIEGGSLLTLPLHHTFAFSTSVLAMMLYGVPIFISKSLRTFTSDMQTFKPQNMFLVPLYVETMYKKIWQTAHKRKIYRFLKLIIKVSNGLRKIGLDFRQIFFKSVLASFGGNLNLIVSGGAPLDKKYIKGFDDFGILVLNGYGITECSPVVAVNRNKYHKDDSVGLPISCCDIKIIDDEICVRGGNVMLGYYGDDAINKGSFDEEWFKTGDLGYIDRDGFLYITGRKKNLIIFSNGKNVSPEELEAKVLKIENVIEVLVYAENDTITAEIYAENTGNIQKSVNELNKTLPTYKQIRKVKFRDTEFDKTTTKKIKRGKCL